MYQLKLIKALDKNACVIPALMSASHFVQNPLDRFESVGFVNANFAEDRQTTLLWLQITRRTVCRINHTQPIIGICASR